MKKKPNFIIMFTDDQGYNDLGCFGSKMIKTPNIDRLAEEGVKFTDFYVGSSVCTPSRAALMTGCYPVRISMNAIPDENKQPVRDVLFPHSPYGLHPDEITMAELLNSCGYGTACVGKWHLGVAPEFLPTRHGFDSYYGIPYSNDMQPTCMMRDETVIENDTNQETLTERYTEESIRFIRENKEQPFFLYLAHNMPHTPLHASERFRGKSQGGLYGDVVECIDWSMGRILETLEELGLDENTLVMFTSDNGPWYVQGENGGNATPWRASKGSTYEGGFRVPCVMRWPGAIPAGRVCSEMVTTMDILPTFAELAGGHAPEDRIIDGKDIRPLITGEAEAKSPHEAFFYYFLNELQAVRCGHWKLKLETKLVHEDKYVFMWRDDPHRDATIPEALYNLYVDPGEQKNVLRDHPDIVAKLHALIEKARADMGDSATNTAGKNVRPIGIAER
jgi:arylsulfatase A-like enzyme